jgi:hypothetical protein
LEVEIEDLKTLYNEGLRNLAKTEEVLALEANVCDLEGQLEFERGNGLKCMKNTRICLTDSSYLIIGKGFQFPK